MVIPPPFGGGEGERRQGWVEAQRQAQRISLAEAQKLARGSLMLTARQRKKGRERRLPTT